MLFTIKKRGTVKKDFGLTVPFWIGDEIGPDKIGAYEIGPSIRTQRNRTLQIRPTLKHILKRSYIYFMLGLFLPFIFKSHNCLGNILEKIQQPNIYNILIPKPGSALHWHGISNQLGSQSSGSVYHTSYSLISSIWVRPESLFL